MRKTKYKNIQEAIEEPISTFFQLHENAFPEGRLYDTVINEVEYVLIKSAMSHAKGVHIKAAKILGINRNTLRKKIQALCIEDHEK